MVKENCPEHTLIILVGNKIDLYQKQVVSTKDAETMARENDFDLLLQVSAKDGDGVDTLVQETG